MFKVAKYLLIVFILQLNFSLQAYEPYQSMSFSDTMKNNVISGAYFSVLGAATGLVVATVSSANTMRGLKFVLTGASLGFITGSLLSFLNVINLNSTQASYSDTEVEEDYYPTRPKIRHRKRSKFEEFDENVSYGKSRRLKSAVELPKYGSLFVGEKDKFGLAVPDIQIDFVQGGVYMALASYRF